MRGLKPVEENEYLTDAFGREAVAFIDRHAKRPFFLYLAFNAVHAPLQAQEKYVERFASIQDKQRRMHAAQLSAMDDNIGRVIEKLRTAGIENNTLIFFLQDNGGCAEPMGREDNPAWHLKDLKPMGPNDLQPRIWPPMQTRDGRPLLGGPGVMPGGPDTYIGYGKSWANVSDTPFREYKHWVHEGGISTPLIAHWPKGIRRGGQIDAQPGQVIDIMATCVDVGGAVYPAEYASHDIRPMEGRSLAPAFKGGSIERDGLFWEHEGNRAVRVGKWKLVAKGPAGAWELYDMEADRTELHDVAAKEPQRVAEMKAKWEKWARRANVLPWIWKPPYAKVAGREPATQPE
jgi:arylsulfatase